MKVWITGADGFIGRHAVAQAVAQGHDVHAVVRPSAVEPGGPPARTSRLALDLDDAKAVERAVRASAPDVIVHLAWYARPADYLESADNVASLASSLTFGRAALAGGCAKLVGAGTCLEYADLPRTRNEDDPVDPKSLYARCKHAAHMVLADLYGKGGASLVWGRLFHMHGPGENPARLVPSVALALREGRPFALSPGEQLRDHLDVRDVASALLWLATSPVAPGPVNVCSGAALSLRLLFETVGQAVGHPELLRFGERPYRAGEVMNLTGSSDRLRATGWKPRHADLEQSIRETVAASRAGV